MMRMNRLGVLVMLVLAALTPSPGWAQDARTDTLRRDIERRFDVLPLRDGVAATYRWFLENPPRA